MTTETFLDFLITLPGPGQRSLTRYMAPWMGFTEDERAAFQAGICHGLELMLASPEGVALLAQALREEVIADPAQNATAEEYDRIAVEQAAELLASWRHEQEAEG